jgi:TetR/AcrR family transcriptional repressor of nem operon
MRYPEGHNEAVRARIIEVASRALRRHGVDAVSIPKLMKLAGLTHGGFYVHFKDRDDLIAAAVAHSATESVFSEGSTAKEAFGKYLSKEHVSHPEFGCVVASLGFEGARQRGRARRAFADAARGLLRRVEKALHPNAAEGTISDETLEKASQIVGAVVLARLLDDGALVEGLLSTAKEATARR